MREQEKEQKQAQVLEQEQDCYLRDSQYDLCEEHQGSRGHHHNQWLPGQNSEDQTTKHLWWLWW